MAPRIPIYVGMATMPSRGRTCEQAVNSLLPQVDRLFLFLDRFPSFSIGHHPKIVFLRSQAFGDLRANGKLLGSLMTPDAGVYCTADDDILYPADYTRTMLKHLERVGPGSVVGVHGSVLKRDNFTSYLKDRRVFMRDAELAEYTEVDVAATCTVAFRTSELLLDVRGWSTKNMVDISFSLECKHRKLRRMLVPRHKGWVQSLERSQPDSIYTQLKQNDTKQTELARRLMSMSISKDK